MEVTDNRTERRMGKPRRDRVRNYIVRDCVGIEGTITDKIQKKRLVPYGHVQRMDWETEKRKTEKNMDGRNQKMRG